jgi:prolipoprotein diacylglyceryltransferase
MESNYKQHQLNCQGRETQNFASLLGSRHYFILVENPYYYALMEKVETQNLASHKGGVLISGVIICMINSAIPACETHEMKIWGAITSNIN